MNTLKSILLGIGIAVAVLVSFLIGYNCRKDSIPEPIKVKVDTLTIYDTIVVSKPISVTRRVVDSVLVPVIDTMRMRDTLYIALEKESVVWRDSLAEVYASGIQTSIDSVRHFSQERIVTIEEIVPYKVKSRWGVGLQVGYGATLDNKNVRLSPYVGVGIHYNIISW